MNVHAYLLRIGISGPVRADRETLFQVHRAHLTAISYENLDIHLGRLVMLDPAAAFDKIVRRGRGGWCYEMNGLLAWALREIGFETELYGAAVGVADPSERANLDHLALCVKLDDEAWLLDAGFGNAFLDPLPLRVGEHTQGHLRFRLDFDVRDSYWRFSNLTQGGPGFDFLAQPRALEEFAERCQWLQSAPESGFVRLTVCHRLRADYAVLTLRGAVFSVTDVGGRALETISTYERYRDTLRHVFALHLSDEEISTLWQSVWPAHQKWLAAQT
jgi:N-hydroxyarylamine O-acetyltransferase